MPIQQNIKFKKKLQTNNQNKSKKLNTNHAINRVKLIIIPTYSITNSKVNSTLTINIQQIN